MKSAATMIRSFLQKHPNADRIAITDFYELAIEDAEDTGPAAALRRLEQELERYAQDLATREGR